MNLGVNAFLGMIAKDSNSNTSILEFQNINLIGPAYGSLIFNYPDVSFRNLTAHTCRCDLVDYMVRG